MTDDRRLRVALLGAGSVGSQVAALLLAHQDELADRAGVALDLVGVNGLAFFQMNANDVGVA